MPHIFKHYLSRTFKPSLDLFFLADVVVFGSEKAVVLCVNEKNQSRPLPARNRGLQKGRLGPTTHYYIRHSTTIVLRALGRAGRESRLMPGTLH